MEADYDCIELVFVIDGYRLLDGESYERRYSRPDGEPLASGHYVVFWPDWIRIRRFNDHALFLGPYRRRETAQRALHGLSEDFGTVLGALTQTDPARIAEVVSGKALGPPLRVGEPAL